MKLQIKIIPTPYETTEWGRRIALTAMSQQGYSFVNEVQDEDGYPLMNFIDNSTLAIELSK